MSGLNLEKDRQVGRFLPWYHSRQDGRDRYVLRLLAIAGEFGRIASRSCLRSPRCNRRHCPKCGRDPAGSRRSPVSTRSHEPDPLVRQTLRAPWSTCQYLLLWADCFALQSAGRHFFLSTDRFL